MLQHSRAGMPGRPSTQRGFLTRPADAANGLLRLRHQPGELLDCLQVLHLTIQN